MMILMKIYILQGLQIQWPNISMHHLYNMILVNVQMIPTRKTVLHRKKLRNGLRLKCYYLIVLEKCQILEKLKNLLKDLLNPYKH